MKLDFDKDLQYQHQAISSIVDLFRGQTPKQTNFTVSAYTGQIGLMDKKNGIGNRLELIDEEILANLNEIQLRNGLPQTKSLKNNSLDFDVEMETGTGKTYVYLRTILELNKNYGFSKFIIVVPSIAIKEGTYKSLQITKEHFKGLYDNIIYDYFIYDSSKLEQVRSFAVSDNIQIMVINIDAFRRSFDDETKENKANIIHRQNDKLNGMKPIELIRETMPIVIIDEPQSVDTTPKSKEAIRSLNPLCALRYSATHVEKHNLVYKLDAIDAFDLKLVKQIEVASIESRDYHNNAYIKLVSVDNKKSPIKAKVAIDCFEKGSLKRKTVTVKKGDDLSSEKLANRSIYEGYIINDIWCEKGNEYIDFTSKEDIIRLGKSIGDIDDVYIKDQQIKKTIEEHLNKELALLKQNVKVLSLFFIDKVANYRAYDKEGNQQKGKYAEIFEKHYNELIQKPKYKPILELYQNAHVSEVHNGYFSTDKKGIAKDTNGNTSADDDAYNLIMRDKEKLLSFSSKLRFIFSHSALREGWDNPNVFQICTLNETRSEVKKRQEIGRGLRLCVDQKGKRLKVSHPTNTLTVMANESYEDFATKLQNEYEKEQNIKFGTILSHTFANIPIAKDGDKYEYLGQTSSEQIHQFFEQKGYIDKTGKVQDKLKNALKNNEVEIPPEFQKNKEAILAVVKKASGNLNIKPASDKRKIDVNKKILYEDFKELWDKIKYKTTYKVNFNTDDLIKQCSEQIADNIKVFAPKLIYTKADAGITVAGVETKETERTSMNLEQTKEILPDIVTYLQNETDLTRKTIVNILIKSNTLELFKKNPQKYMEEVLKIITSNMRSMMIKEIEYTKIGDDSYYEIDLFENNDLFGYISSNMIESTKTPYNHIIYDSSNERSFAERFESMENVLCYAKLPDWFKISTPLSTYNPDWAVLINKDGEKKLYFVLETKANTLPEALRPTELDKIKCGKKHFEALGDEAVFESISDFNKFIENV